jgi:surfeit locus 1 family protein
MLLALAVAIGLGMWQYHAWGAHRAAESRDLSHAAPVRLSSVMTGDSPFPGSALGRPVSFSGKWLPAGTIYVSHRRLDDRTGYWVVTPVLVGKSAMPVVRGWATQPKAPAPAGDVSVTGWLQASEGATVPDDDPSDDVIPSMRIASIVEHVDADIYSGYVVARSLHGAADAATGVRPVTPASIPAPSSTTALRNLLYAIEWWFFGGFAVYAWVRWCRDVTGQVRSAA